LRLSARCLRRTRDRTFRRKMRETGGSVPPVRCRTVRQENGRFPGMASDQPPRTSKPPENPFPKSSSACPVSPVFSRGSLTSSCRSTTMAFSLSTAGALLSCSRPRLASDTMAFLIFTDTWRCGGQSQLICVGTLDLASVSAIVRRVSDSVRPDDRYSHRLCAGNHP